MTEKMTVVQYAALRGVKRRTVIDWIRRKLIAAERVGYGPTSRWIVLGETTQGGQYRIAVEKASRNALSPEEKARDLADRIRDAQRPSPRQVEARPTPEGLEVRYTPLDDEAAAPTNMPDQDGFIYREERAGRSFYIRDSANPPTKKPFDW